jgi:hypothetical protein
MARLARENIPPTNQYAPRKVMKITVVIPGDARNIIPISRARTPQRRRIHQGKSPAPQVHEHPHEHSLGIGVAVVSVILYLKNIPKLCRRDILTLALKRTHSFARIVPKEVKFCRTVTTGY